MEGPWDNLLRFEQNILTFYKQNVHSCFRVINPAGYFANNKSVLDHIMDWFWFLWLDKPIPEWTSYQKI